MTEGEVVLPDVNILLYATVDAFPLHPRARRWWEDTVNANKSIGLGDPALFGFLRIATNPRILNPPLSIDGACVHVHAWLSQPNITRLVGGSEHVRIAVELLRGVGTAGNLTTDAQIAALAIEHGATVYSNDTDFARFSEVRWVNPLS